MGKTKIPSVDDALLNFKDVMHRASLTNYLYVNKTLLGKNAKDQSILIIPDQELWLKILDDPDLKKCIKELDISNQQENSLQYIFTYADSIDDPSWIDINVDILFAGKIFKANIDGLDYEVPINKNLIPLRLKKAEYTKISYKIFKGESIILGIKKRFDFPIKDYGYSIIRLFKVI